MIINTCASCTGNICFPCCAEIELKQCNVKFFLLKQLSESTVHIRTKYSSYVRNGDMPEEILIFWSEKHLQKFKILEKKKERKSPAFKSNLTIHVSIHLTSFFLITVPSAMYLLIFTKYFCTLWRQFLLSKGISSLNFQSYVKPVESTSKNMLGLFRLSTTSDAVQAEFQMSAFPR